jgi:oxygen-independent coproporphyrinogen-3 oxidase
MTTMNAVSPEVLRRFDVAGPRYTSYPTADRFVEAFDSHDYARALKLRQQGPRNLPLSLYVHIPFCESLCYYCACNKIITKHHDRAAHYLRYLAKEVALHVAALGQGQSVSQLHLGGGTPTFFSDAELQARVMDHAARQPSAGARRIRRCRSRWIPRTVTRDAPGDPGANWVSTG